MTIFDRIFPWWPNNIHVPVRRHGRIFDYTLPKLEYRGNQQRQYRVYVPAKCKAKKQCPVVMVLHGCLQDHMDMQVISDWDAVADQHQFIVVYPFVTEYHDLRAKNCWGWWRHDHIRPGQGEVEDLKYILREVSQKFSIDPKKCFISGLSSGAAMTVAALVVHAGLFAAGASVAGVAYGETPRAVTLPYSSVRYQPQEKIIKKMAAVRGENRYPVPLMIVQSHDDDTVGTQAAENLRDSWLDFFNYRQSLIRNIHYGHTKGVGWEHNRYIDQNGVSHVETLFLDGPDHGWYGGSPGDYSFPEAPNASRLIWKFFEQHQLNHE